MSDATPTEEDFAEAGRKLFAGPCDFRLSVPNASVLPPPARPEIAFAGRSNVGKSSLVNALTGRKTLARTSSTPGRTQELVFFDLGDALTLVDMPGYGYAAAPHAKVKAWTGLIHHYLRGRPALARVYVLIDARHGLKEVDSGVFDTLDKAAVSYQVVLTKADQLKQSERDQRVAQTSAALARRPAAFPEVLITSARTGEGIAELRGAIARLVSERTGAQG
jgi:GTP-binding protein